MWLGCQGSSHECVMVQRCSCNLGGQKKRSCARFALEDKFDLRLCTIMFSLSQRVHAHAHVCVCVWMCTWLSPCLCVCVSTCSHCMRVHSQAQICICAHVSEVRFRMSLSTYTLEDCRLKYRKVLACLSLGKPRSFFRPSKYSCVRGTVYKLHNVRAD